MRFRHLVSWTLFAGLCAACGSSTEDGDSVAIDALPGEYAKALCAAYQQCVGDLPEIAMPGEDCVANTTIRIQEGFSAIEAAIDDGRVSYDGSLARTCIDTVAAYGCGELLEREPEACRNALEGSVAEGGDCTLDEECRGEAYCDF